MDNTLILLLIPLVIIQLGLQIFALYDIYQRRGARPPLPTWVWGLIVVSGQIIGPVVYLVLGRKEDA